MKNIKNNLLYAGMSKEDYNRIKNDIEDDNKRKLPWATLIAMIILGILSILSLSTTIAEPGRWLYISMFITDLALFIISKSCKLKDGILTFCIYLFWSMLLAMGMVLAFVVSPDKNTVTFIALILIGPQLFTDKPVRVGIFILAFTLGFIVLAFFFKAESVCMMDVVNVMIFSLISILTSFYTIRLRLQRYQFEYEANLLSTMDLLIGVNNRNSYEKKKVGYLGLCKKDITCFYLDANGLHELNNTRGHQAGDEMLKMIAEELKRLFGASNVYRMGGDEFVAFVVDEDAPEAQKKFEALKRFSSENEDIFSVGYAVQPRSEMNIDRLVESAESEMFRAKAQYYYQCGEEHKRS